MLEISTTKRNNVLVEKRAASFPYENDPITIPAARLANSEPRARGLLIDSKYVGKITVSIGIYIADRNTNEIVSESNGLSVVKTRNPLLSESKKRSCPSSSWAIVLPWASSTFMSKTNTVATPNITAVIPNANIGPLNSMHAAPIAGPTIHPIAKIPSCRPFAESTSIPEDVAALGINALRAV